MGQRLSAYRSGAYDCGGFHDLAFEARAVLSDLEFHNAGVSLGRTLTDADKRSASGFGDSLVFPLCPDARRVIVIVLYWFATGDNDRPLSRLRKRGSGRLRYPGLIPALAPAIIRQ